jgi:hypothetical protein
VQEVKIINKNFSFKFPVWNFTSRPKSGTVAIFTAIRRVASSGALPIAPAGLVVGTDR